MYNIVYGTITVSQCLRATSHLVVKGGVTTFAPHCTAKLQSYSKYKNYQESFLV